VKPSYISFILALGVPLLVAAATPEVFMPGEVMRGHAEIESQCLECHEPWSGPSTDKCVGCHLRTEPVVDPQTHGRRCLGCHPEHTGRNVSISRFDHRRVGYEITEAHADLGCRDCHLQSYLQDPVPACKLCHQKNPGEGFNLLRHESAFGGQCLECHRGGEADLGSFDHLSTGYAIDKHHYRLGCRDCHPEGFSRDPACDTPGCHGRGEMYGEHVEHGIYDYDVRSCLDCHRGGKPKDRFREWDD
jgi:hypothetical protein